MRCVTRVISVTRLHCEGVVNCRGLATSTARYDSHSCRLLVVGGGSGGCATAAKFARTLGKGKVIIVEPTETHYYQPLFTLVGGGLKQLPDAGRAMSSVLPSKAQWLKDEVVEFEPKANRVRTKKGDTIEYDFMVIAAGIVLDYQKIPGVLEALKMPDSGVCSIYSPLYVRRTFEALHKFKGGNAVFTFPNTPVKCAGAPQKILYLSEDYLARHQKKEGAKLIYNTSLGVIFGVKKYADALWKVAKGRGIEVNLRRNLVEVNPDKKEAVFQDLDKPDTKYKVEYSMLHVTPPQSPPAIVRENKSLADSAGFLDVNKQTLQHVRFPNVFGIGDCTNLPTSKTAAAVAAQTPVLYRHLSAVMSGKSRPSAIYDGYTSCPLVTAHDRCILAEFDYDLQPLETFPVNQAVERKSMYLMKAYAMPELYWNLMTRGFWEGPGIVRKMLHLGMGK